VYLNDTVPTSNEPEQKQASLSPTRNNPIDKDGDNKNPSTSRASRPWTVDDGGQLRLYIGADSEDEDGTSVIEDGNPRTGTWADTKRVVDIAPDGGRLILFSSARILHEVRPTFRTRHACTIWFTLN
jgi:hypothetical protein